MSRKPNLFMVGAPKCGTTAMYEYLRAHPQIFMAPVKEPYYFGKDLTFHSLKRYSEAEYLALFEMATDELYLGEASITSLYSISAAQEIYEFNPMARIIIMLRNPVEMLYSLHSQLLFTEVEDIQDFEKALAMEGARRELRCIPSKCTIVDFLFYRGWVQFPQQIRRYLKIFEENQVHVIIYDDFRNDVESVFYDTLAFLGVDTTFAPEEYAVINRNKVTRSLWLRHLMQRQDVVSFVRRMVPSRDVRQKLAHALNRANNPEVPRPPMDPNIRSTLEVEFAPIVEELENLLGCDLTHWIGKVERRDATYS